jgi:hypothetical protein
VADTIPASSCTGAANDTSVRAFLYARNPQCAQSLLRAPRTAFRLKPVPAQQEDDADRVNWSIRLVGDEAALWDELVYRLRQETGRRTLSKADIMRTLVRLATNDAATRRALVDAL